MEMIHNMDNADQNKKVAVTWGHRGSELDNNTCVFFLLQFVAKYGGPQGKEQWRADGIGDINEAIWHAANSAWGFPKFTEK